MHSTRLSTLILDLESKFQILKIFPPFLGETRILSISIVVYSRISHHFFRVPMTYIIMSDIHSAYFSKLFWDRDSKFFPPFLGEPCILSRSIVVHSTVSPAKGSRGFKDWDRIRTWSGSDSKLWMRDGTQTLKLTFCNLKGTLISSYFLFEMDEKGVINLWKTS